MDETGGAGRDARPPAGKRTENGHNARGDGEIIGPSTLNLEIRVA